MTMTEMLSEPYLTETMILLVEWETDLELDPDAELWAKFFRDIELMLDLTGNLDSCA